MSKQKSNKPKRKLVDIRAEKSALINSIDEKASAIRAYITGKIPPKVVNGSHQDAVEFKQLCENCKDIYGCPPSLKKKPAKELQERLDKLKGIVMKFEYFSG